MAKKEYNPDITTYGERTSQEAAKATHFINLFLYWMTNCSSPEFFNNAFGTVMGNHFWKKIEHDHEKYGAFYGDIHFWFEMTNHYRDQLMHYLIKTGYDPQTA